MSDVPPSLAPAGRVRPSADPMPALDAVLAKAGSENFPVALGILPRRLRAELMAIYGFARLVDDIGDETAADRFALLDRVDAALDALFAGKDVDIRAVAALAAGVRAGHFAEEPLRRLVEANRIDQRVNRYDTFNQLRDYCSYSADPVGRLVLGALGADTPDLRVLSDRVCTGLQIVEHLQDVAEDLHHRDRIYLPAEDMARFGVTEADLRAPQATSRVRALISFEASRARELFTAARPLTRAIPGRAKLAVAAFAAGGLAALHAMARVDYDVLAHRCRPKKSQLLLETLRIVTGMPDNRAPHPEFGR
ncbi:Squalene/phytoene synthase [Acidothermus cellulolyticus 11B]|uniref:Squalene/phytoene synthase n=1 Tax=Acidothermus cellulolyticus (strain ATCC 43068 / DSM 8971 / 11B) TaxID=351607 RepID=A0LVK5_ACIC1|nr:Squalene/phytoene synthase [Acidothermus cellulolyticus 11B]